MSPRTFSAPDLDGHHMLIALLLALVEESRKNGDALPGLAFGFPCNDSNVSGILTQQRTSLVEKDCVKPPRSSFQLVLATNTDNDSSRKLGGIFYFLILIFADE